MPKKLNIKSKFSFEKKIEDEYPLSIKYHPLKKETIKIVEQFAEEYREYKKTGISKYRLRNH